ncbi:hypothetical protein MRX96_019252 [Rhipicephalus microplus]
MLSAQANGRRIAVTSLQVFLSAHGVVVDRRGCARPPDARAVGGHLLWARASTCWSGPAGSRAVRLGCVLRASLETEKGLTFRQSQLGIGVRQTGRPECGQRRCLGVVCRRGPRRGGQAGRRRRASRTRQVQWLVAVPGVVAYSQDVRDRVRRGALGRLGVHVRVPAVQRVGGGRRTALHAAVPPAARALRLSLAAATDGGTRGAGRACAVPSLSSPPPSCNDGG